MEVKTIKEGQMKNAIMDTVEDQCRNADIPKGASYDQAVAAIVKSIRKTDTIAAECSVSELTGYVKEYFTEDEYVAESADLAKQLVCGEDASMNPNFASTQGEQPSDVAQAPAQAPLPPEQIGKAGDYLVMLDQKSEIVTITKGGQVITSMPLVIWTQLKRS
jgi:hypothetical protein